MGNGKIRLELRPEVSRLDASNPFELKRRPCPVDHLAGSACRCRNGSGTDADPGRAAGNAVRVPINKLPYLGDLPLVGVAFRKSRLSRKSVNCWFSQRPIWSRRSMPTRVQSPSRERNRGSRPIMSCMARGSVKWLLMDVHPAAPGCRRTGSRRSESLSRQASSTGIRRTEWRGLPSRFRPASSLQCRIRRQADLPRVGQFPGSPRARRARQGAFRSPIVPSLLLSVTRMAPHSRPLGASLSPLVIAAAGCVASSLLTSTTDAANGGFRRKKNCETPPRTMHSLSEQAAHSVQAGLALQVRNGEILSRTIRSPSF